MAKKRACSAPKKYVRLKRACTKCQLRKTKCLGEKPCLYCVVIRKPQECVFILPEKPTMVTLEESYVNAFKLRIAELERRVGEGADLDLKGLPLDEDPHRRMSLTHIINKTENTNESTEYVLERELAVENMLVDADMPYRAEANIFLGNLNCSKFNITIQHIVTLVINRKFAEYPGIPRLPPPVLPTVFYRLPQLHWAGADPGTVMMPQKEYSEEVTNLLFEALGQDVLIVNRIELETVLNRVFRDPGSCLRLDVAQVLVLIAMGETLVASRPTNEVRFAQRFPGFLYFKQAVQLFQDQFEEFLMQYVETCLLFAIYLLALNRKDSAYMYTGLAVRLAYTLGLHREVGRGFNGGVSELELEKRRRLWWNCYIWDRTVTIRLGHPVMINDDSMDVKLPLTSHLLEEDRRFYPTPAHLLIEKIKLARISGLILTKIYRIDKPKRLKDRFIVSAHSILNILRFWYNELNSQTLDYSRLDPNKKRQSYSLHLHYNYCVVLTTRPLLLYVFKDIVAGTDSEHSPTTLAILKSCVNASMVSLKILQVLQGHDAYAIYSLTDNNFMFSLAVVLLLMNAIKNHSPKGYDLFTKVFYKGLLTPEDMTQHIKFATSMLGKGATMGSVCSRVYFLQLSGLIKMLEKLHYVYNPSPETLEDRLTRVSEDVIADVRAYNRLNEVRHHEDETGPSFPNGTQSLHLVSSTISDNVEALERQFMSNNDFDLLNDEMLGGFLDNHGWDKEMGPESGLFEMFDRGSSHIGMSGDSLPDQLLDGSSEAIKPRPSNEMDIKLFDDIMSVFALGERE